MAKGIAILAMLAAFTLGACESHGPPGPGWTTRGGFPGCIYVPSIEPAADW